MILTSQEDDLHKFSKYIKKFKFFFYYTHSSSNITIYLSNKLAVQWERTSIVTKFWVRTLKSSSSSPIPLIKKLFTWEKKKEN